MPAHSTWQSQIDEVLSLIENCPHEWIAADQLAEFLDVTPRYARRLMENCPLSQYAGRNRVLRKEDCAKWLQHLVDGGDSQELEFEKDRRKKFAAWLNEEREERIRKPRLLVSAPMAVINQRLWDLPEGIQIEAGKVTVRSESGTQMMKLLLLLAMAMANDPSAFQEVIEGSVKSRGAA